MSNELSLNKLVKPDVIEVKLKIVSMNLQIGECNCLFLKASYKREKSYIYIIGIDSCGLKPGGK